MSRKGKEEYFAYYVQDLGISGVVRSWEECQSLVNGQKRAVYKKFLSHRSALEFLLSVVSDRKGEPTTVLNNDTLYFDSGTGRGEGVEISVTNAHKESQLHHLVSMGIFDRPLSERGTYVLLLNEGYTNNFGELLSFFCALKLAHVLDIQRIAGDSKLVLDYWSLGYWNASKLPERTVELAKRVKDERKQFEAKGGEVSFISGGENPADLGFHR